MKQNYEPELKQEIIRLYLEEGRTMKSLTEEFDSTLLCFSIRRE